MIKYFYTSIGKDIRFLLIKDMLTFYTLFINIGRNRNFELENILDRLLVYNPPAMMEQITNLFRPIIAPGIINKIELVNKTNSDDEIQTYLIR